MPPQPEPSIGSSAEKDEAPVVSVVTPVYNASAYLSEAIDSILAQTFSSFELILVEDGSTDHSRAIAEAYAAAHPRIRLIVHKENRGNYPSRNEGIKAARGEFIAVMDADDIALPHRLERQVDFLRRHPEYALVGSQALLVDPEGAPLGPKGGLFEEHEAIDAALMEGKWAVIHPAVLMRREAVEAIGRYRERFRTCADHDIYIRLAEVGRIANLPEVLLHYRQHYSSLTRLKSDQERNLRIIQREARQRRGLPPLEEAPVPPVQEAEPLSRFQKIQLHLRWASLARRSGYVQSAVKNYLKALFLSPVLTLRLVIGRLKRRLMQ